ncbi:MAG: hypothetical protein U0R19_41265 [Bryobacteraceae bacterium]
MQFRRTPVVGVVYNTTLSRPDAALTLALLYGYEGKREARVASIAVTENSLGAAMFADAVFRFYQLGPVPNANRFLPIGLAVDKPLPADSPMVKAALERVPAEKRKLRRVSDTAEVTALMRNSLAYIDDGFVAMVLSAPVTYAARILDSAGSAELVKAKVRVTVVSECRQDAGAMRRMLAEWPAPFVFCGRDVGEAVKYPGSMMAQDFGWAEVHPVVDFYKAAGAMPYDAPAQDLIAALYAMKPDAGFFELTRGTITVADDGRMGFAAGDSGKHQRLGVVVGKKDELVGTLREMVAAKPVAPQPRRRFTAEELEKFRKEREEEQRKRELEERKAATKK